MLFSGDDAKKKLAALSGGEAARLVFARLAIEKPNVLVLDEPTNHLDLESIEALVEGLQEYDGHAHLRVARSLVRRPARDPHRRDQARRHPRLQRHYDEYIHASGDDHLDVDRVVGVAREAKRRERSSDKRSDGDAARPKTDRSGASDPKRASRLAARRDELLAAIEAAEARLAEIDEAFADPTLYDESRKRDVRRLDAERAELRAQFDALVLEWEGVEKELDSGGV